MLGVYTIDGVLVGHYENAGDASRVALGLGEGARVTSAGGAYVVRDGVLRLERPDAWTPWELLGSCYAADYIEGWMATAYGGCQN